MSIDQFGRAFNNEEISLGIGRTVAGDFNAFHKRIENVATPYRDKKAANAYFVLKQLVHNYIKIKVGVFYGRNSIIKTIKDPVDGEDVVKKIICNPLY